MKKIISIDGGGIRGIVPGQVLIAIEQQIQDQVNDPHARLADYFDFFAGTSTGGILTAILLHPKRYSAKEAVNLYVELGQKIFESSAWQKFISIFYGDKYKVRNLEACLSQYIGDTRLSQLTKPCIITAYDIERRVTKFFSQQDRAKYGPSGDYYLKQVCRATSAAPTYFQPMLVQSLSGERYACVDGGVFANNPALCAYSEVRNSMGAPTAKDMFILSLGTGTAYKPYSYSKSRSWGKIGWVEPAIDIMMSGQAEVTSYHLLKMFSANSNQRNLIRIEPRSLGHASPEMDCVTRYPSNIDALIELGKRTAYIHRGQIGRIVDIVIKDRDEVKF